MRIYFAQADMPNASNEDDYYYDLEGSFEFNGEHYWNYIEYGTNPGGLEEVAIVDGCDRFVPIHVEHLAELIAALERVKSMHEAYAQAQADRELAETDHEETARLW